MASRHIVNDTMPACFKAHYPQTQIIIDCTEIFIQMPSSFRAQSQTYSQYKSHNTAKGLVGISPSGMITFISHLYGGHVSDKAITQSCGLIDLLEAGDVVMADKGFDTQDLLVPHSYFKYSIIFKEKGSAVSRRRSRNTTYCICAYSC